MQFRRRKEDEDDRSKFISSLGINLIFVGVKKVFVCISIDPNFKLLFPY